jgi:hypothetical protein
VPGDYFCFQAKFLCTLKQSLFASAMFLCKQPEASASEPPEVVVDKWPRADSASEAFGSLILVPVQLHAFNVVAQNNKFRPGLGALSARELRARPSGGDIFQSPLR